eukprot:401998-Amphidinium_carterae.1
MAYFVLLVQLVAVVSKTHQISRRVCGSRPKVQLERIANKTKLQANHAVRDSQDNEELQACFTVPTMTIT